MVEPLRIIHFFHQVDSKKENMREYGSPMYMNLRVGDYLTLSVSGLATKNLCDFNWPDPLVKPLPASLHTRITF